MRPDVTMPTCSASAALHWRLPGVPARAMPAISRVSLVLAAVPVDAAGSEDHQNLTKELPPSQHGRFRWAVLGPT